MFLALFAHLPDLWLQAFAHRRFDRFIRLEGCLGGVAQHVELTHLVRYVRPEFLDGQQFTFLGIGDRSEHFDS